MIRCILGFGMLAVVSLAQSATPSELDRERISLEQQRLKLDEQRVELEKSRNV